MSLMTNLTKRTPKVPSLVTGESPHVNLLPPKERERRERSALTRRWGAIALAAVLVVALAVVATTFLERSARDELKTEQARTATLATQLATYRDVSAAARDKSAYEAYRAQAMGADVTWKDVLGALQASLPASMKISAFDAVVGDGAAAAATPSGTNPSTLTQTAPGGTAVTATVQVTSKRPVDQTAMITAFSRVQGVIGVDLTSLTSASATNYSSSTTVYFDQTVLSGRYAKAAQ